MLLFNDEQLNGLTLEFAWRHLPLETAILGRNNTYIIEITSHDRQKAAEIIRAMQDAKYSRRLIAEMIGIDLNYVSMAAKMTKRPCGEEYLCPRHAILKVLNFAVRASVVVAV